MKQSNIPQEFSQFYLKDVTFVNLMMRRIYNVLIVANPYDAFMLEDDGRVEEKIYNEYMELGLRYPPTFTQVSTTEEALRVLRTMNIDLVICMPGNADNDAFTVARDIKSGFPDIHCVVLTPFSHGITRRMQNEDLSIFDYVFCWLGNTNLILSIIKLIEDKMNIEHDIHEDGVQMILLVEDSIRFYSSILPNLYSYILAQSKRFSTEALNRHTATLRMRGRPKVVLARTYEEAMAIYDKYSANTLGVISDVRFPMNGVKDPEAGLKLLRAIRAKDEYVPLIMESSEAVNRQKAEAEGFRFVDKNSKKISIDLRRLLEEHLGFGVIVDDDGTTPTNEWTAFDNFRMLYAGEYEGPSLVLDEDNPDLSYLTETSDEYKNVVLHLNRTFTLNQWNTLTLPENLTYGQMKRAFGNDMMLAELYQLNANSVRFKTVSRTNDDEVMLTAYTPYIIKPTKGTDDNVAYTTPRLRKADNQFWLGENEGKYNTEDGVTRYTSGQVSIKAGHYDIPNVTLNRELLKNNLDAHWVSTTTTSASTNDMVCKGTMAKTYYVKDGKGYFYTDGSEQRDALSGDYFMNKGTMYKVPSTKQYGLKAFRCWFELTGNTDNGSTATAPAKEVSLVIDGIEDNTTGIDTVVSDPSSASAKAHTGAGVYNLNGQLVRPGTSLDGLPKGIYIVNGKKVKK